MIVSEGVVTSADIARYKTLAIAAIGRPSTDPELAQAVLKLASYVESIEAIAKALSKCVHRRVGEASAGRWYQCPDCFATWKMGELPP